MSVLSAKYPVMELCLSTVSGAVVDTDKRKFVGDIIAIRKPTNGAGLRELKRYLWLRSEQIEENDWAVLVQSTQYEKRRFCIPLERLKNFVTDFDVEKAMNREIIYQPFMPVDKQTGLWLYKDSCNTIDALGLIYDKKYGIYI